MEENERTVTAHIDDSEKGNSWLDRFMLPGVIVFLCAIIAMGLVINVTSNGRIASAQALAGTPQPTAENTPALTTEPTAEITPTSGTPAPEITPSAGAPTPAPTTEPIAKGIIVVDAGHGGFDPGTLLDDNSVVEKDINLQIALKLQGLLEAGGYKVVMTRTTDTATGESKEADMEARGQLILSSNADMFICIHQDAFPDDTAVRGPHIYYHPNSVEGEKLALAVQKSLDTELNIASPRSINPADHTLTKYIEKSILIECGFITNPEECALLLSADYQAKVAKAIYDGILAYIG